MCRRNQHLSEARRAQGFPLYVPEFLHLFVSFGINGFKADIQSKLRTSARAPVSGKGEAIRKLKADYWTFYGNYGDGA